MNKLYKINHSGVRADNPVKGSQCNRLYFNSFSMRKVVVGSILLLLLISGPMVMRAQIGVGTTSPHPSAMLHISPGAGNNKGVILPTITSGSRVVMDSTQNISHGLIFFDRDLQKFYYFHQSPKQWFEMDHDWIRKDVAGASPVVGTHIYLGVPGNVGIGTAATVNPAAKLTVVGNMSVGSATWTQDSVPPANSLIVQTWLGIATETRTTNFELDVNGQANIRRWLSVRDSVVTDRFRGEGVIPTFGIVMYSGVVSANFPGGLGTGEYVGWALCDGRNGTPDLRGRFIAGRSNTINTNYGYVNTERNNTDYNAIGDFGGEAEHILTVGEMPSHNHSGSTTSSDGNHSHGVQAPTSCEDYVGASQSGCTYARGSTSTSTNSAGSHSHNVTVTPEGGDGAHENRPPYYVLAFLMKLP